MINLVSYFEIGGRIIECETKDDIHHARVPDVQMAFESKMELTRSLPGNYVTEKEMIAPKLGKKRLASRATRAYRAGALAGTLAAADGPLPIGDVLAIGVLSVYAGYETYRILDELL